MWGMSSVFVDGRALYVHGGRILQQSSSPAMISTSITFSLDLSTAWEASQPNFTLMTTEGPTDYLFTSTLILNDNAWIMISNATGSLLRLDRTVDIWSEVTFGANIVSKDKGLAAATDPITGSIYIINGGLENSVKKLFTYNNVLNQYKEIGQTVPMESGFAASWSVERKRMYIHGGVQGNVLQSVLYEFLPSNDAPLIQSVTTSGDAPTARQGHCMVSAYGGAKMVVFGGFGNGNTPLGDIYFLESNSTGTKWTKGTNGDASVARAHTACAVTNDLFVAWGGTQDGVNTVTSNITIVYNLKTNQWQTNYSPLPYVAPPTATTPGTGSGTGAGAGAGLKPTDAGGATDSASGGSSTGAIIGGVVGGLAVIGIVVGLFIYRKRQAKNITDNADTAASKPRSVHKENINLVDNNGHFDEVPVTVAPPKYNIFQPLSTTSSAAAGPSYQLAYIDHYRQQEQQQQQQYRYPQDRQQLEEAHLSTSQTAPFAASSPVNSAYTSTVNSSPRPAIMHNIKPRINTNDTELLYLPETRHPHTLGDGEIFMDIHTPNRHPHTQPQ
ncbi:hypothetical protein KI688_012812 [Linnemannia hyalina]|uniref:Galactose oxidase n=1 Tax=Linnemannia hyalina TaxID=64524 RepID=A0A9P7XT77_9FUNG|nr:hypothetical protein KI688_012812 [Linnemannia hyalina]